MFTLSLDAPALGAARLRLAGHLDDVAARDVLHAAADAVRCGSSRLVVDLHDLDSFDVEAAFCVVGCCRLGRFLAEGVVVLAGSAAGEALAQTIGVGPQHAATHGTGSLPGTVVSCPAC